MSIDWSKAPVGTIGRGTVGEFLPVWIGSDWYEHDRESGGRYFFADVGVPVTAWRRADVTNYLARPTESPAWTGTGLPPVGTVCEYYIDDDKWRQCEIVAHKDGYAVIWLTAAHVFSARSSGLLRPIRTQEQIEAEEREKAISHFAYVLYRDVGMDRRDAELLWNKGYRKQPKEGA